MAKVLLNVEDVKIHFPVFKGILRRKVGEIKAVDGISFELMEGETLGVVGESGCGKSTIGRALLRLYDLTSGEITLRDKKIGSISQNEMRELRPQMQMIFQDPQASLNPRMTVGGIIGEPMYEHLKISKAEREERVFKLMDAVGLNRKFVNRYPHEFSGGQKQRIGIARALALNPALVVCDEPIAALDVSIQAQVVNLLAKLQKEMGLTFLFISHDLSMVRHIADRVAVMYLGRIVELATVDELYEKPLHPYTQALLSAVPEPDPRNKKTRQRIILQGDVPSPRNPPKGCSFCTRCPRAEDICRQSAPNYEDKGKGHFVACHFVNADNSAQ